MQAFSRIQSPSSINTYKQCARKYYYLYIEKLPTSPSIHLTRGKLVHSVLEDFFTIDITKISSNQYAFELQVIIFDLFYKHWNKSLKEINSLGLSDAQVKFYYNETKDMIQFWISNFVTKLAKEMRAEDLIFSFNKLKPLCELEYRSEHRGVRGFIDAIHEFEDGVVILDYKTSKKDAITPEYRLQLAIYAMMYFEKHDVMPRLVGVDFLKFGERYLEVTDELLEHARTEVALVHERTQSTEIARYDKSPGPLCNYCDFKKHCF